MTFIVAAGLAACSEKDPVHPPDPVPSRTPVFASEEEALAAAEEAYANYLAVANEVAQDGGARPERFTKVATEVWLQTEIDAAEDLQATGNRQVGEVILAALTLQSADIISDMAEVAAYVCLDLSTVQFVDSDGADVTPVDRELIVPIEVFLESSQSDPTTLLIASNEPWSGQNFCF